MNSSTRCFNLILEILLFDQHIVVAESHHIERVSISFLRFFCLIVEGGEEIIENSQRFQSHS